MSNHWSKKLGAVVLAVVMALSVWVAAPVPDVQAASKAVTVKTQQKLEKVLKSGKYTKITISNTGEAEFTIPKGTYKSQIVLNAKEYEAVNLTIEKGASIKKGLVIKGSDAQILVSTYAKVAITARVGSLIRIYPGAEGTTVVKKASGKQTWTKDETVYVRNYSKKRIKVTERDGSTGYVEKAKKLDRQLEVSFDPVDRGYFWVKDDTETFNWNEYAHNAVYTVDGKKILHTMWKGGDGSFGCQWDENIKNGSTHVITVELEGYEMYSTEATFVHDDKAMLVYDPIIQKFNSWHITGIQFQLIPKLLGVDVMFTIDEEQVTPYQDVRAGNGNRYVVLNITDLEEGDHVLKIEAEGYTPYIFEFKR